MFANDNTAKELTYYKDPKYSSGINKNNDRNSGANPFYLHLPGSCHLLYENNTGIGQKYVTIDRITLPSAAAKTASEIADKLNKKKASDFDFKITDAQNQKDRDTKVHDVRTHFGRHRYAPIKPALLNGCQGKYYMVNGEKYDEHFPYEWATNHLSHQTLHHGSGPLNCINCKKYGSILTVFVGYCMDCHNNIYKGSRPGINDAVKTTIYDFREILPYMKDVCFKNIGDRKGWTLLKERQDRQLEEEKKKKNNEEYRHWDIQKRNDLLVRTRRDEYVSEEEWDDYWGFQPVSKEDLFKWATSEYL
jgi:hypothetical protein